MTTLRYEGNSIIYLDHQATTPMDPEVFEAIRPYFTDYFGNAASRSHAFGWIAEEAVEKARLQVAELIGARDSEIVFTSGATESINTALLGVFEMYREKGNHIITCVTEHKATLDTCHKIEEMGGRVTYLPVDTYGNIDLNELSNAITDQTILVSLMHANNEIGTIHPIAQISQITREKGIILHVDAAQSIGKLKVDVNELNIDLLSLSGHKIYGPKGVGALYVRKRNPRIRLSPILHGGGHERGMRSGTLNVPGIVGLGKAAEICARNFETEVPRLKKLRDLLKDGLFAGLDEVVLNGDPVNRLVNNLNISFKFVEGEALMMGFSNIAVSSGSACTSASLEPSYVLKGCGLTADIAHTSIRFSVGRFTTEEEIKEAIASIVKTVTRLREMSPLYEMHKEGIDISKVNWKTHA